MGSFSMRGHNSNVEIQFFTSFSEFKVSKFFGVSCRVLGWLLNQPQRHLFFDQKCLHRLQRPSSLCLCSVCLYVLKFCGKPECTCATKIKSYCDLTRKHESIQTKVLHYYFLTSNLAFYQKSFCVVCCALKNLILVTLSTDLFWFFETPQLVLCSEVMDRNLCQSSVDADCNKYRTGGACVARGVIGPLKFWS